MAIGIGVVMGVVGAMVALLIGILIFSEVESAIDCKSVMSDQAQLSCESAKDTAWLVIAILPIALFFALFSLFGGIGGSGGEVRAMRTKSLMEEMLGGRKPTLKEKRRISKEKQRKADELMELERGDLVQHSFLTNWLRRKKNG